MPTSPPSDLDQHCMAVALRLAERGLGSVWPNPAVGCVLAQGGRIVGRGWTQPGGRPHAEVEALRRAGSAALGATAYVSLEPCAHYGHTPPCTMALLQAGVRRVVIASVDPDPRVDGRGIEQLRQAGVEVVVGLERDRADALNAGFILSKQAGRPLVTLKLATSLDGKIATRTGESQWITGEQARAHGHLLRRSHDAVMVGSGTALADDPELTCRLPGALDRRRVRMVLDRRLRVDPASKLVRGAHEQPTWLFTAADAASGKVSALRAQGVEVLAVALHDGRLDLGAVLAAVAARGITRLLVEGGAELATSLLRQRRVDRLAWFRAPMLIGADGHAAIGALGVEALVDAIGVENVDGTLLARDRLERYMIGA